MSSVWAEFGGEQKAPGNRTVSEGAGWSFRPPFHPRPRSAGSSAANALLRNPSWSRVGGMRIR